MQDKVLAVEPALDLVLDLFGAHQYATEIARRATALAAPHASWNDAA